MVLGAVSRPFRQRSETLERECRVVAMLEPCGQSPLWLAEAGEYVARGAAAGVQREVTVTPVIAIADAGLQTAASAWLPGYVSAVAAAADSAAADRLRGPGAKRERCGDRRRHDEPPKLTSCHYAPFGEV